MDHNVRNCVHQGRTDLNVRINVIVMSQTRISVILQVENVVVFLDTPGRPALKNARGKKVQDILEIVKQYSIA